MGDEVHCKSGILIIFQSVGQVSSLQQVVLNALPKPLSHYLHYCPIPS